MIAINDDDCLAIGTEEAMEEDINLMKEHDFGWKVEDNLTECLVCKIFKKRDKGKVGSIKTLIGSKVNETQSDTAPVTPQFKL
jgi:hypothetical protein